jgi:hypothetical protein
MTERDGEAEPGDSIILEKDQDGGGGGEMITLQ